MHDSKSPSDRLTHVDESGAVHMVDVGNKAETYRVAVARGWVRMNPETLTAIQDDAIRKGDVLGTARIAAIQAAKKTSELIPLCHPLPLTSVKVELRPEGDDRLRVEVTAETRGRTGVEMEALTATSTACLTIYDMCKAIDRGMTIESVQLVSKSGGKSGDWTREEGGE